MTLTRNRDKIALDMSVQDFRELLLLVGYAAGAASAKGERATAYRWIKFANELNATNPGFQPYEIPPEFL